MISHILSVGLMSSLAVAAPQFYYPQAPVSAFYQPSSGFYNPSSGFQYVPTRTVSAVAPAQVAQPVVAAPAQPGVNPALMDRLSQLSSLLPALETLASGMPTTPVNYESIDATIAATRQLLDAVPLEFVPEQYREAIATLSHATRELIDHQQVIQPQSRAHLDDIIEASRVLIQAMPQN